MARNDFQLLLALIAPLLVWPWVPGLDGIYIKEGLIHTLALFTAIPLLEEMLFRGVIQGWLLEKDWFNQVTAGASRANWFSSIAFAGAHLWQHSLILLPGYFLVSLLLGHFRERFDGILVPVLLHAYYNLGLIIIATS